MLNVEKMRGFIIKFVFFALILGLTYAVIKYAMPFLTPFVLGFLIAFLLNPLINKIVDKTHLKRKPVSVLVLLVFYVIAATLIIVLGTRIVLLLQEWFYELPSLYSTTISPALIALQDKLEELVSRLNPTLLDFIDNMGQSLTSSLSSLVATVSTYAITSVTNVATGVPLFFVKFILTIIVSFFCVVDYRTITSFIARQLPGKAKDMLFKVKTSGIDVIFKFARAYAILLGITFVELSIGLSLFGIPNAILLSFGIAIVDILPILGTGTILIPWGIISIILGDFALGIGILILYAIVAVVRQILEPRVVGKQIGLYPLVTLACMFIGAQLFGILGLFGLPIMVTIIVQLNKTENFKLFK